MASRSMVGATRSWIIARLAGAAVLLITAAVLPDPSRAQSCDDFDDCTVVDTCQADGSCKGTPKANGTGCDDGNACTSNDHCLSGRCVGAMATDGTPCTSPLGACMTNAKCTFGFCLGDIVECPDTDGNKCTIDFCDPRTGQCTTVTNTCNDQCSSGQCDPATGECISVQPVNEGLGCDDGNVCTGNDRCHAGDCAGAAGTPNPPTATPTQTPFIKATFTPTALPSPTDTGVATATEVASATPSISACIGDCSGDGNVTVDELIKGVNIALNNISIDACPSFDVDGDGSVTIDEIIKGVKSALSGCEPPATLTPTLIPTNTTVPVTATPTTAPSTATATVALLTSTPTQTVLATTTPTPSTAATTAVPSATSTRTATGAPTLSQTASSTPGIPSTPTMTPTLGAPSVARRVAGAIPGTTNAFLVIPNLLSAVLGHSIGSLGNAEAVTIPPVPFTCSGGGGGTVSCNQSITPQPPFFGPPTYVVSINNCVVNANGRMLTFDGGLTAQGQQGDVCGSIPNSVTLTIAMLTVTAKGAAGSTTTTFNQVSGGVDLSCSAGECQCSYDTVTLHLSGSMAVTSKDTMDHVRTMTQATFSNDDIGITVEQYGSECVPVIYSMQVDGDIALTTDANSFQATFSNYILHDNAISATDVVDVSGQVTSGCLGGAVVLSTPTLMSVAAGDTCPSGGEIQVATGERVDLVRYTAAGGVEIDLFDDNSVDETFTSCLDPRLSQCPA